MIEIILFFLVGYAIILLNPYKIMDYIYAPIILFFCMGGIYLFFSTKSTMDLFEFSKQILTYLSIFLIWIILFYVARAVLLYSMRRSFFLVFLFYMVVTAIIYKMGASPGAADVNDLLQLTRYLIFYIPCLFADTIEYFVEDAKKTNQTTYILGFLLLLLIVYFFYPIRHTDGRLLIDGKTKLNKSVLSLNLEEVQPLEGFRSLSDKDLERDTLPALELSPDLEWLKDLYLSLKYDFFMIPKDTDQVTGKPLYTYQYGMSFWLYLESEVLAETRDKALIMSFGSRPSLFYDYNRKQLVIEVTDYVGSEFKQTRVYYSSNILFQKWNHMVMNYVNGQFDLFINNELVATQSNISPYINATDLLQVGSVENSDLGGISQFRYYDTPLSQDKIKKIYSDYKITD